MNIDIPDKEPGEAPATEKQKAYIRRMGQIAESDIENLGKWQASSLIEQMQYIKKSGIIENIEHHRMKKKKRQRGCLLWIVAIVVGYFALKAIF